MVLGRFPPKVEPMLNSIDTKTDLWAVIGPKGKDKHGGRAILGASHRHAARHVPPKAKHRGGGQADSLVAVPGRWDGARFDQGAGLSGFSNQPLNFTEAWFNNLQPGLEGGDVAFPARHVVHSEVSDDLGPIHINTKLGQPLGQELG